MTEADLVGVPDETFGDGLAEAVRDALAEGSPAGFAVGRVVCPAVAVGGTLGAVVAIALTVATITGAPDPDPSVAAWSEPQAAAASPVSTTAVTRAAAGTRARSRRARWSSAPGLVGAMPASAPG